MKIEVVNNATEKTVGEVINVLQTLNFFVRWATFDEQMNVVGPEYISSWCSVDFENDPVWLDFFEKVVGTNFWTYWEVPDMHFALCAEDMGPFMLNRAREMSFRWVVGG